MEYLNNSELRNLFKRTDIATDKRFERLARVIRMDDERITNIFSDAKLVGHCYDELTERKVMLGRSILQDRDKRRRTVSNGKSLLGRTEFNLKGK